MYEYLVVESLILLEHVSFLPTMLHVPSCDEVKPMTKNEIFYHKIHIHILLQYPCEYTNVPGN